MFSRHSVIFPIRRHLLAYYILLVCALLALKSLIVGSDAFSPSQCRHWGSRTPSTTKIHSQNNGDESPAEMIRAAAYQTPARSNERSANPLETLKEVADSLRVASMHGVDVVLFPELFLSGGPAGSTRSLDRESYELNIVGNMCGELNVACVIGYAESIHESESRSDCDDPNVRRGAYNSIAAFHADGSRAGNYRCVSAFDDADVFAKGQPIIEFIPTSLQLPNRQSPSSQRQIKLGMVCGNDVFYPEHCRHLVRSGAQIIFASTSFRNTNRDLRMVNFAIPCRAMENQVPFLFANFVGTEEFDFIGSSAIVSPCGEYLVCGPQEEYGDMPSDCGYLVPCDMGILYAADIDIDLSAGKPPAMSEGGESGPASAIRQSIDQWDLMPRMPGDVGVSDVRRSKHQKGRSVTNGFGRDKKRGRARRTRLP